MEPLRLELLRLQLFQDHARFQALLRAREDDARRRIICGFMWLIPLLGLLAVQVIILWRLLSSN